MLAHDRVASFVAFLAFAVCVSSSAIAEQVDTAWVRYYDGVCSIDDRIAGIAVDETGCAYVAGMSQAPDGAFCPYDIVIIKYTPAGDTAWVRSFSLPGGVSVFATDIAVAGPNYVIVTGYTDSTGTDADDWITVKYTASGSVVWTERFNSVNNKTDRTVDLEVDRQGNVWLAGTFDTGFETRWYMTKYDTNGNELGFADYTEFEGPDAPLAMALDTASNAYVVGTSVLSGNTDATTLLCNTVGGVLWVRRYDHSAGYDVAREVAVTPDQGAVMVGDVAGVSRDIVTIKYEADGDTAWMRIFDGPASGPDEASDVDVDGSGNIYVLGAVTVVGTTYNQILIKYKPDGDTAWVRYATPTSLGYQIAVLEDGRSYICGTRYYTIMGTPISCWAAFGYSPQGDTNWFRTMICSSNFSTGASEIALHPFGGAVVGGNYTASITPPGMRNFAAVWYKPTCACDCHGDPAPIGACDGVATILDVTQVINVAFRNAAPILDPNAACPYETTDVGGGPSNSCDGVTTILDVVKMVNAAFRNANPATEFCNPCP